MANQRLDSRYFCSPGTQAHERLAVVRAAGVDTMPLGGPGGLARISAPNRFTRAYASSAEDAVPYLRPYDMFEYLPQPADFLSVRRTAKLDAYRVQRGTILQSCSGRNLGPAVMADAYLSRFVLSHDMIRVVIDDANLAAYVLAYLNTPTGQALLRRDKTGSVIDHISPVHVSPLEIPILSEPLRSSVSSAMADAVKMRERARAEIEGTLRNFERELPTLARSQPLRDGWTQASSSLDGRLDAARYDPLISDTRRAMMRNGGVRCGDVASAHIPGRYVRYYVDPEFGTPILSGRQLLQVTPINLQYISERSFANAKRYELHEGSVAMQAEGRAEERLAFPVMITPDRDGWLGNNHILRLTPEPGVNSGALLLAMACMQTQSQVKALATGSVVDAVNAADIRDVILPPLDPARGAVVTDAWRLFSRAQAAEDQAVADLEAALTSIAGEEQLSA